VSGDVSKIEANFLSETYEIENIFYFLRIFICWFSALVFNVGYQYFHWLKPFAINEFNNTFASLRFSN